MSSLGYWMVWRDSLPRGAFVLRREFNDGESCNNFRRTANKFAAGWLAQLEQQQPFGTRDYFPVLTTKRGETIAEINCALGGGDYQLSASK